MNYVHWTLIAAIYLMIGIFCAAWMFSTESIREAREEVMDMWRNSSWEMSFVERMMLAEAAMLWPLILALRMYDRVRSSRKVDKNGQKEESESEL